MSLSGQVGLLATRVGTELKSIRNNFVPNTLRGPIGGITTSTGVTGAVTIDPALSNHRRLTATGDVTINLMAAGTDGQRVLFEVNASAGQRVVTFDAGYELSSAVPVRSFTIPSGGWAYVAVIYRGTTWRLTSAEPQATPDYSTPSIWVPADHGLLAWTNDPIWSTTTFGPPSGTMVVCAVKVSTSATTTGVWYGVATAGSGLTAARNYIGLYNAAGALIAQTADQSTVWTSTGTKNAAWATAATISPGTYFVGAWATGTAPPVLQAASTALAGVNRTTNSYRGGATTATFTSMPTTKPVTPNFANIAWFGLS